MSTILIILGCVTLVMSVTFILPFLLTWVMEQDAIIQIVFLGIIGILGAIMMYIGWRIGG